MAGSLSAPTRGRRRAAGRLVVRVARRVCAESLYLLTAPLTAAAALLAVLGGLGVGALAALVPNRTPATAVLAAPVRWSADLERWRIGQVRPPVGGGDGTAGRSRPAGAAAASDPGLWLGLAHVVIVLPVALVTAGVTAMWWFCGAATATTAIRNWGAKTGPMAPMTLSAGGSQSHIDISLGLTAPADRMAFGTVLGLVLLTLLPTVTRLCVGLQAGLGRALLSDSSALHRRIRGLEQERDTARERTAAAVSAEAAALRRLERDIHDGPQQRLVRLAIELGRAQRQFDRRPEAVREALADAIAQTEEAMEELRVLSRGIAPPVLADRGLREALADLAARSTVPVDLDVDDPSERPSAAVETAAYFVVAEAMTNVAKHSQASRAAVGLRHGNGTLRVWVSDDGVGGAALGKGHGLRGLDDRVRALGGELRVASPAGGPTRVTAELPCP
jgi:signal transduction histidine kinase